MPDTTSKPPELRQALPVYLKIGLLSFGGPAGQIALMQSEFVERRGWVKEQTFDRGLAFAMMLPGPEAQQLATWIGWRLGGVWSGIAAGLAFILPGAALMILLAWVAAAHGTVPWVAAIFAGVQPVVIAAVLAAMMKIASRALKRALHWALAAGAFAGLYLLGLPFPLIVALAAVAGLFIGGGAAETDPSPRTGIWRHLLRTVAVWAALGLAVFGLTWAALGRDPFLGVAELFTTAAFVTFGGAYAVLPFVADRAVEHYGWLSAAEMLNGLAIAEATPGPLILVNTYAGFFAGWSATGAGPVGALTAILATFYTFVPSFMLILGFAPVVERVQGVAWARRALAGVSAAVVGVVANLALYLAEAAFLPQGFAAPEWTKLALFVLALGLVFWARLPIMWLVGFGVLAGLGLHTVGLM